MCGAADEALLNEKHKKSPSKNYYLSVEQIMLHVSQNGDFPYVLRDLIKYFGLEICKPY